MRTYDHKYRDIIRRSLGALVNERRKVKIPEDISDLAKLTAANKRIEELEKALVDIRDSTDPDDENSWRGDDRESCLDHVHHVAKSHLAKASRVLKGEGE